MPIYRFRILGEAARDQELGFYHDRAASDYARKLARGSNVEVWREAELIARVEAPSPALAEAAEV